MQIRYKLESTECGKYTWPKSGLTHENITRLGTDMIFIFHYVLRHMKSNLFFATLRTRFVWNIHIIQIY